VRSRTAPETSHIYVLQPHHAVLSQTSSRTTLPSNGRWVDMGLWSTGPDTSSEGPTLDISSEGPTLDISSEGPTLDISSEGPTLDISSEGPTLDTSSEGPTLDISLEGPTLDISSEGPTLDIGCFTASRGDHPGGAA
jgi:hypothetical protein